MSTETVEALFRKATDYADKFEYELAIKFLLRILEPTYDPSHLLSLHLLGELSIELCDAETALHAFSRCRELDPTVYTYDVSIAQLMEGKDAIEYYKSGISKFLSSSMLSTSHTSFSNAESNRTISNLYCSVAEIYATDLCQADPDADLHCLHYLKLAEDADTTNPEVYYLQAQLALNQNLKADALTHLQQSLSTWESLDPLQTLPTLYPSFEFRFSCAKLALELKEYDLTIDLLEDMVEEQEALPDVWYLLGLANHLLLSEDLVELNLTTLEDKKKIRSAILDPLQRAQKLIQPDDVPIDQIDEEALDMFTHINEILVHYTSI